MLTRRFTLLEFAAVVVVVAILVYALATRLLRYFEIAEKAAMTVTVLEVERSMRIRVALARMKGAPAPAENLEDSNPFEFAHAIPPNYLGELGGQTDLQTLKPGNWFYDLDRHEIAYQPRLTSRFRSDAGAPVPIIRFRAKKAGERSALPHLAAAAPYQWEPEFASF